MIFEEFERICTERHAVREFDPKPVSRDAIESILKVVQSAPSAYNLQPVSFYVVTQQQLKEKLLYPCMNQKSVISAPVLLAFAVDRDAAQHNFERIYQKDVERGLISEEKKDVYAKAIEMGFSHKPFGMGWVAKAFLVPILRLITAVPTLPAIHKSSWTALHAGMSSMLFILTAQSKGLSTCPITSFDEQRVKRILSVPFRFDVPIIVAAGYSSERPVARAKLPLDEIVHWN